MAMVKNRKVSYDETLTHVVGNHKFNLPHRESNWNAAAQEVEWKILQETEEKIQLNLLNERAKK